MITKAAADYTPNGTQAEHCAICRHYIAPKGDGWSDGAACQVVIGSVSPQGWCNRFEKERRAA